MPKEGSRRHARMVLVKSLLARYKTGLRYDELANRSGLSHPAVCTAVQDLLYEADVVIGIPAYDNNYNVTLGWKKAAGKASRRRRGTTPLG